MAAPCPFLLERAPHSAGRFVAVRRAADARLRTGWNADSLGASRRGRQPGAAARPACPDAAPGEATGDLCGGGGTSVTFRAESTFVMTNPQHHLPTVASSE